MDLLKQVISQPQHYRQRFYFGEVFELPSFSFEKVEDILPDRISNRIDIQFNEEVEEGDIGRFAIHCFYNSYEAFNRPILNSRIEQKVNKTSAYPGAFMYDVFLIGKKKLDSDCWVFCLAVPYVRLGVHLFEEIEKKINKQGLSYKKVDLTRLITNMQQSYADDSKKEGGLNEDVEGLPVIKLKRFDCVYDSGQVKRISVTGNDLLSYNYFEVFLDSDLEYEPVLCGLEYSRGAQVRPINFQTDKDGNFRFWIGNVWQRMLSLFDIMEVFEMRGLTEQTIDRPSAKLIRYNED